VYFHFYNKPLVFFVAPPINSEYLYNSSSLNGTPVRIYRNSLCFLLHLLVGQLSYQNKQIKTKYKWSLEYLWIWVVERKCKQK